MPKTFAVRAILPDGSYVDFPKGAVRAFALRLGCGLAVPDVGDLVVFEDFPTPTEAVIVDRWRGPWRDIPHRLVCQSVIQPIVSYEERLSQAREYIDGFTEDAPVNVLTVYRR